MRALLVLLALATLAPRVFAHEVRPAYLELHQTGPETYDALWKVPGLGEDLRLGLYVELPAGCANVASSRPSMVNNAFTERWTFKCAGGLSGGTIHIAGLSATTTDVLVRLERLDGSAQVTRLTPSAAVVRRGSRAARAGRLPALYGVLGVEHILTGIDHLLFVLALLIITRGGWKLVKTVSAFTVSHSITLTAATLGYVHVPARPVEAVIALSIVFVAAEIVACRVDVEGITARAPWIVAFAFGLIHGLGFAGGLSDAGLPAGHIPAALLFFSMGVEAGHFLFIGVVLSLIALVRHPRVPFPRWTESCRPTPSAARPCSGLSNASPHFDKRPAAERRNRKPTCKRAVRRAPDDGADLCTARGAGGNRGKGRRGRIRADRAIRERQLGVDAMTPPGPTGAGQSVAATVEVAWILNGRPRGDSCKWASFRKRRFSAVIGKSKGFSFGAVSNMATDQRSVLCRSNSLSVTFLVSQKVVRSFDRQAV